MQTCTLGDFYEQMLLDRLTQEEFLPVNFKEYYTFALHGTTGTAHDVRFSLSASSIDRLYAVCRDGNYQTAGIKARVRIRIAPIIFISRVSITRPSAKGL